MDNRINRRRFQRFTLQPMYTPVAVRVLDEAGEGEMRFDIEGHAYDISEGGVRFEVDRLVEPGTRIAMQITLPALDAGDVGPGRSVYVFATVVWVEDADEPGPYRTAAVFNHFARVQDRQRLLRQFSSGRLRIAA